MATRTKNTIEFTNSISYPINNIFIRYFFYGKIIYDGISQLFIYDHQGELRGKVWLDKSYKNIHEAVKDLGLQIR